MCMQGREKALGLPWQVNHASPPLHMTNHILHDKPYSSFRRNLSLQTLIPLGHLVTTVSSRYGCDLSGIPDLEYLCADLQPIKISAMTEKEGVESR